MDVTLPDEKWRLFECGVLGNSEVFGLVDVCEIVFYKNLWLIHFIFLCLNC